MGQADHGQRLARLGDCLCRVLAAHIQGQPDIIHGGQGRKQMKGLEDEPDMIAPKLASSSGPAPSVERPATRTLPRVGVSMHPSTESSVVLPLPGRPHQQRQLAACERQADALERLNLGCAAAEEFHDVDGLETGAFIA